MKLIYSEKAKEFLFHCRYTQRNIPSSAGFKYDPQFKLWRTGDIFKAYKLKKYAPQELKKRFERYRRKVNKKVQESQKSSSDIEIPKPDNGMNYYPFQKAGIEFLENHKYALLADEQGLGKSIEIVGLLNRLETYGKVLLIVPNTLKINWKYELRKWLVDKSKTISINSSAKFKEADIMIINYEAFRYTTAKTNPKYDKNSTSVYIVDKIKKMKNVDLIILDESHRIKNYQSNTTKNIFKIGKKFNRKILMSGTPVLNKPVELWTTIRFLNQTKYFGNTKRDYAKQYCDLKLGWGNSMDMSGASNLDELQVKLRKNFMIRRTKSQVLTELPPKTRKIVRVEVDPSYFEGHVVGDMEDINISGLGSDNPEESVLKGIRPEFFEQLSEFRVLTGKAKIQPVYDYVKEDLLEQGEKVVFFGHHTEILETYKRKFKKWNPAFITGKVKQEDRQAQVDKFQNDDTCRIIILNLAVGGEGLTLTKSSHVVFSELDWVPAKMLQGEDRCHRISQIHPVTAHYILADSTLDAKLGETIVSKLKIFDQITNIDSLKK